MRHCKGDKTTQFQTFNLKIQEMIVWRYGWSPNNLGTFSKLSNLWRLQNDAFVFLQFPSDMARVAVRTQKPKCKNQFILRLLQKKIFFIQKPNASVG